MDLLQGQGYMDQEVPALSDPIIQDEATKSKSNSQEYALLLKYPDCNENSTGSINYTWDESKTYYIDVINSHESIPQD